MPTILQLNCTSNWGSTGKIAEQIGLKAQSAGWECYVAFGRESNPSALKNIKVGNMLWTIEHYAENRLLDNEGLASRISTRLFLKEIDKIKPDVVHLHNIHDHWLNYKLLFEYLAEKQIPVVWTQHDQWAITGHCYYNLVGCERWKTECYDCPLSKWYCLDRSRRNFNLKKSLCARLKSLTIVPVSEWLADSMRQSHLKDRPIEVIHNGIDISVFKPQTVGLKEKFGIGSTKIVLGVSSVWSNAKGLADFIKLSENDEFQVVLVGVNDDIKKRLPNNIIAIKNTQNQQELAMLYSMADVFVNPTYADMFPTVNLEALACGTPVITYKTGGSPESVGGKSSNNSSKTMELYETGAVVEYGNIEALAATIREFRDTDFKKHHSASCRKRAEECFDKDKCFEKYVKIYEQLISR